MSNVSKIGAIRDNCLFNSKKTFQQQYIGHVMCELGDNMGHGDHTKLGIFKINEEEDINTYAFTYDKTIGRTNFDNLSTLYCIDKSHGDKGNVSQYGKGLTSFLIMSEKVHFINVDEEKKEAMHKKIRWKDFKADIESGEITDSNFDKKIVEYQPQKKCHFNKYCPMKKRKKKKQRCENCLEETFHGDYIRRHNGELCELGKLFEKIGCDFKFIIFAEFSKENSKCIDTFIEEELPTFQNRYSLTNYEFFVGQCHYEDEKKAYVKKIHYYNGLHTEESRISLKARLINLDKNTNLKRNWYIKFGKNPYCIQVYMNNGKHLVIHEKELTKDGKFVDINKDYQIEYEMYIIDPKINKKIRNTTNKTGVQIVSPENIILNGHTIKTEFMKSKNINQNGGQHLAGWRCIVRVGDITLSMTEAEKWKTKLSSLMTRCIRKMHCNIFIGKDQREMAKYKIDGKNFQASKLPKTYEDDYVLDDGTFVKGINTYTKEELVDAWKRDRKKTTKTNTKTKTKTKTKTNTKKSVVEKEKPKTGILYIVSYHELDLMSKELGYPHLNKCGYSESTEDEVRQRYQKQSLKKIKLTIVSEKVINPREVETHMWFKQEQMAKNNLVERLKQHPKKDDYVCSSKELFTLDVAQLKLNAERAIRGMEHNMSETDEDSIDENIVKKHIKRPNIKFKRKKKK